MLSLQDRSCTPRRAMLLVGVAFSAISTAACSEAGIADPPASPQPLLVAGPSAGIVTICTDDLGPVGDYSFAASVSGGSASELLVPSPFVLTNGACVDVWQRTAAAADASDPAVTVTVTQVAMPSATQLDSIVYASAGASGKITGNNTVSLLVDASTSAIGTFFNSATAPSSAGGCTASRRFHKGRGYYKNRPQSWPAGFRPDAMFFGSGLTWLQVLRRAPDGNAYYILAARYITVTLDAANGAATSADVQAALNDAKAYFTNSSASLTRHQLLRLAARLSPGKGMRCY